MTVPLWNKSDDEALAYFGEALQNRDAATALFAIEGASLTKQRRCHITLSKWAEQVEVLASQPDPHYQVPALTTILVDEQGFRGDQSDYYNPRNSYLSQVMRRRRGLPILLACIWSIVGERAGIQVEGVGIPYHFITRVGGPEGILVDPFGSGRILTKEDCEALVKKTSQGTLQWSDHFLKATNFTSIIERVLQNLISSLTKMGQLRRLYRCIRFAKFLCPQEPRYLLAEAEVAEELNATDTAEYLYTQLLQQFGGRSEGETALTRLLSLSTNKRLLN